MDQLRLNLRQALARLPGNIRGTLATADCLRATTSFDWTLALRMSLTAPFPV